MDTLQSLLAAQAPMVDQDDLPDEMAFAPSASSLDDAGRWDSGDAGEITDRAIFAGMVAGG